MASNKRPSKKAAPRKAAAKAHYRLPDQHGQSRGSHRVARSNNPASVASYGHNTVRTARVKAQSARNSIQAASETATRETQRQRNTSSTRRR